MSQGRRFDSENWKSMDFGITQETMDKAAAKRAKRGDARRTRMSNVEAMEYMWNLENKHPVLGRMRAGILSVDHLATAKQEVDAIASDDGSALDEVKKWFNGFQIQLHMDTSDVIWKKHDTKIKELEMVRKRFGLSDYT
jgi:hypothetical protein